MGRGFELAGAMGLVSLLFILLTLTFFGAMCFAADDIRRYLKQIATRNGGAAGKGAQDTVAPPGDVPPA